MLIRNAEERSTETASEVKKIVQNLVDEEIDLEEFSRQLQGLRFYYSPIFIKYIKDSLPRVRHDLSSGVMTIEGILPPRMNESLQIPVPTSETLTPGPIPASNSNPSTRSAGESGASSEQPLSKKQKSNEDSEAPAPASEEIGCRQDPTLLNASVAKVVKATLDSLASEDQRLCISQIFRVLSKFTASPVSPQ